MERDDIAVAEVPAHVVWIVGVGIGERAGEGDRLLPHAGILASRRNYNGQARRGKSPVSPSVPVRHNENYMPDESSRLTAFVERVCSSGTLFSLSEASCVVRKKNTRTSAGLEQPSGPNP